MAPIFLKDFTWSENDYFINIRLKWPCNASCNPDILTHKKYIKISSSPFIFELFLSNEIDKKESKCFKAQEEYLFELKKVTQGIWNNLERKLERHEKVAFRIEALNENQILDKEETENRKKEKRELQNIAVQEQIGLDSQNIKLIEDIKLKEKQIASNSLQEFKCNTDARERIKKTNTSSRCSSSTRTIFTSSKSSTASNDFPIPLIREEGRIEVHFSEREFPTPSRESLLEEEKEFLAKQLAARRATGFVSEDLRPEECNPVWLKNKGDEFHKNKNYLGAVSAYSHAIKIGSSMPAIFSNRAASHMALGNLHKALEDCSTALELLKPAVSANAEARARAYGRRATILCLLGLPEKSLPEFEEAIRLRPNDIQLREDFEKAKLQVEDNGDSE